MYFSFQQVTSGIHQSSLTLCDVSNTASSPSLSFPGTSPHPMLDLASQHTEGNGNKVLFLANNNSVIKSETPKVSSDKPFCASFPTVEVVKTQDYPSPQPIPEGKNGQLPVCTSEICWIKAIHCPDSTLTHLYDTHILLKLNNYAIIVFKYVLCVLSEMLHGWWRLSDMEELHSLVKALHSRGIREKVLQKQIQKHMDYMTQLCANSKDGAFTSPLLS